MNRFEIIRSDDWFDSEAHNRFLFNLTIRNYISALSKRAHHSPTDTKKEA